MAIARFFYRDPKNVLYALVQTLLSCLCTVFNTLEFVALALVVPLPSSSSSSALSKFLAVTKAWLETKWQVAIAIFLLAFGMRGLCNFLNVHLANYWQLRGEAHHGTQLLRAMLAKPLITLEQEEPGSLCRILEHDAQSLAHVPLFVTKYFVILPIVITTLLVGCAAISWHIIVMMMPSFVLFSLLRHRFGRIARLKAANARALLLDATGTIVNYMQGISIIKSLRLERYVVDKLERANQTLFRDRLHLTAVSAAFGEFTHLLSSVTVLATVAYAFYGLGCSVAEIIIIAGFLSRLHKPIKELAASVNVMSHANIALKATSSLDDTCTDTARAKATISSPLVLMLERVAFGYGQHFCVRIPRLTIYPGDKIALVGKSGAGKSTLLKLLCGAYTPREGIIRLNDVVIDAETRSLLSQYVTYVPQKPFLFSTTIRENIDLHRQLSLAHIQKAVQTAGAETIINALPHRYDTIIHNDGSALSLGQKQRLHLARAFARATPILLLDEPTSSLDRECESTILAQCLARREQTVIIVSHRPEILGVVNRILHIDEHGVVRDDPQYQAPKCASPIRAAALQYHTDSQQVELPNVRPNELSHGQMAEETAGGPRYF